MSDVVNKIPIFAVAIATLKVTAHMRDMPIGSTCGWDELHELSGVQSREKVQGMVRTAKRALLQERLHFRTIAGVGVQSISHGTVADEELDKQRQRIVSASKSVAKSAEALDLGTLTVSQKHKAIANQTIAALTCRAASDKAVKRLVDTAKILAPMTPSEAAPWLLSGSD